MFGQIVDVQIEKVSRPLQFLMKYGIGVRVRFIVDRDMAMQDVG